MTKNDSSKDVRNVRRTRTLLWVGINVLLPASTLVAAGLILWFQGEYLVNEHQRQSLTVLLLITLGTVSNVCNELRVLDRVNRKRLDTIVPLLVGVALLTMGVLVLIYVDSREHFKKPFLDEKLIEPVIIFTFVVVAASIVLRWYYLDRPVGAARADKNGPASETDANDDSEPTPRTLSDRLRVWSDPFFGRVGKWLAGIGVHPDAVTGVGLLIVLIVAGIIALGDPTNFRQFLGSGILLAFGLLLDRVDGAVARAMNRKSAFGKVFDSSLDRLEDGLIYAAIFFQFMRQERHDIVLLAVLAMLGSYMVSYVRARAEAADVDVRATVGLLTRVERSVILVLILILTGLLENPEPMRIGLAILMVGTHYSWIRRLDYVRLSLESRKDRGD